ncbi:CIA30 family protein [bacterium]|nr:CIA30 family protein [bacterium]
MRWEGLGDAVFSLDESIATFKGEATGGGTDIAPAVRIAVESENLDRFEGLAIRAEGGGVPFDLCLHAEGGSSGGDYRARFDAPDGELRQIRIPFAAATVEAIDAPPLDPAQVTQIIFAIAPEHAGPFRLQVEWVRAYGYRGR